MGQSSATETGQAALRNLLIAEYDTLWKRLTRRLGSSDFARETLQETFLRLERTSIAKPLHNPKAYLFRIAVNIAADRKRSESRLSATEIDTLFEIADDAPDAERTVEARSELEALNRAILELPPRRRKIFLAVRIEGVSVVEVAVRFGVTRRTIEIELKQALEHCAFRLERDRKPNFGSRARQTS